LQIIPAFTSLPSQIPKLYCHDESPVGVELKGIRKLQVNPSCRWYGTTVVLCSGTIVGNICTQVKGDFLSQITLQYDCCKQLGIRVNLSKLTLDLAYRKTVPHLNELIYASKKVSDLLEEVKEQEWKSSRVVCCDTHCFTVSHSESFFSLPAVQTM
jgi:hypothetical protein